MIARGACAWGGGARRRAPFRLARLHQRRIRRARRDRRRHRRHDARARRWCRGATPWRSRPAAASRRTSRPACPTAAAAAACCTSSTGDGDRSLTARAPASAPVWVSDQRLLFLDGTRTFGETDAYAHAPGTGDSRHPCRAEPALRLQRLPHLTRPLADPRVAVVQLFPWANTLHAVRLDGSGEQLLTDNMYAYHMDQIALTPFAFTGRWYAGYLRRPTGLERGGIYAASLDGSDEHGGIADGWTGFVVSPSADRVAAHRRRLDARSIHRSGRRVGDRQRVVQVFDEQRDAGPRPDVRSR